MLRSLVVIACLFALSACPIVLPRPHDGEPVGEGVGEGEGEAEGEGEGGAGFVDDGAATRLACTNHFGSEVSQGFGRLDGIPVAIVGTNQSGCRADDAHVHLQIETNNEITDVAVNLDTLTLQTEHAPVDAWVEGWHPDVSFDYARDLGEHAAAFAAHAPDDNEAALASALADANHVSIYAKGYDDDGIHDVHRNGSLSDGAIVVRPTEESALYLLARFSDQSW